MKPKDLTQIADMLEGMTDIRDPREKAYEKLVDGAYLTETDILRFSTLNPERIEYVLKNLIFINFYINYFSTLRIRLIPDKENNTLIPVYEGGIKDNRDFVQSYQNFLNAYLKCTMAEKGKVREEILKILRAGDQEMSMLDRIGGMFNRGGRPGGPPEGMI